MDASGYRVNLAACPHGVRLMICEVMILETTSVNRKNKRSQLETVSHL
jgi:hypothetical protein